MQRKHPFFPLRRMPPNPLHVLAPLVRGVHCFLPVILPSPGTAPAQIVVKRRARGFLGRFNLYNPRRSVHHTAKLPVPAGARNCHSSRPAAVASVAVGPAEPLFWIKPCQTPVYRSGPEIPLFGVGKRRVDRVNVGVRQKPTPKLYAVQHRLLSPRLNSNAGAAHTFHAQRLLGSSKLTSATHRRRYRRHGHNTNVHPRSARAVHIMRRTHT